jgi:hypothetical protein
MIKIVVFIVRFIKGIVILTLPGLMIYSIGEEAYSESFFLSIYILKCIFSLIAVWVISDGIIALLNSFEVDD